MIVWQGFGFLAALIPLVCGMALQAIIGDSPINTGIGYILGAIPVWYLGKKWNAKPGRTLTDNQSGEQIEVKNKHSFFWIKMEYWAGVAAVIGIIMIVSELAA